MLGRRPDNLPAHQNPHVADRVAAAPYNFVPLPDAAVVYTNGATDLPSHGVYDPKRHSGWFDVVLTTRAPVYIRCPFPLDKFQRQQAGEEDPADFTLLVKNTPWFFHTGMRHNPVIPGSSLRGMLRALLEIVSYGKVAKVTDNRLIFRAVGDPTSLGNHYRGKMTPARPPAGGSANLDVEYPSREVKGGYLVHSGVNP